LKSDEEFNLDQWYKDNYNRINATAVPNSLSNRILHKIIEKPFKSNLNLKILEVGANAGEHLPYVSSDFASYIMTDIRPLTDDSILDRIRKNSPSGGVIDFQVADVQSLPFDDSTFDRVISTCLFHHLDQPIKALSEIERVTKTGGTISILIPNDPGILYRLLRGITTLRAAKKEGLYEEAQLVHAIEHRNHFLQLRTLLESQFKKDRISFSSFPFKFKSYNLNALTVFHINKVE
jgi:phosphatidylethanolamine/phosphatidyl-N-methylethanolamine N-methyltransferase